MADENWQQIREIFDGALRRRPEERDEYIRAACVGNETLLADVGSLLAWHDDAEDFLETPALAQVANAFEPETVRLERGRYFGHYQIVEQIGVGGMGEVYLARDTKLDRKVAVKILNEKFSRDESNLKRFVAEAKAASALNHPNILVIHEIGTDGDAHYIVSEYVKGKTLRQILTHSSPKLAEVLDYATQIAFALSAAHEARLIHRDVKPENIIVRPDGFVKVLDFGLAKLIGRKNKSVLGLEDSTVAEHKTAKGVILGTINYMSPEQAKGGRVDERTDVFSLGVVLYEMISGTRPFAGNSTAESIANLINIEPGPLDPDVPTELQGIVSKMLRKDPEDRYQSMRELLADLRELKGANTYGSASRTWGGSNSDNRTALLPQTTGIGINATADNSSIYAVWHKRWRIEGAIVTLLALSIGGYWLWQRSDLESARSQVPRIEELAKAGKVFEAFDLASTVIEHLPGDPSLAALMPAISDTLTVTTDPAGAQVYLKRYQPDENSVFPDRQLIGTTPISGLAIPRGPQIVYIEKEGHAPVERTILGRVAVFANTFGYNSPPIKISQTLIESGSAPEKMVFVPGGDYRLLSWQRPNDEKVRLDDYFIDKYEVSNRDFKEFVSGGGYAKQEYWKVPVLKDGHTLSWGEAMSLFRDRTSLPGPREWANQDFPSGRGDHPVTAITWYEAAAYAEFKGKKLPTIFQWEKASNSRDPYFLQSQFMPWGAFAVGDSLKNRANFDNSGTLPVDSGEFGMGPYGAFNLAGNVSEWTLNEGSDGFYATGGAWGEPIYTFSFFGVYPGLFESSKRGFRCARLVVPDQASGDQGGTMTQTVQDTPDFQHTTDAQFRKLARPYDYDKTPLDPQVIEVVETADWRREKVTFNGASGERAIAYLYLPHNAARPLQVIQFLPGSHIDSGSRPSPPDTEAWLGPAMKAGRAVLAVVAKGNLERPWPSGFEQPGWETTEFRDLLVNRYTDHRRGLDYLETRDDIDMSRAAFAGLSSGASQGLILPALETRYRAVFLIAGGLRSDIMSSHPSSNPVNFAPHIRAPKYVLNGRFDEAFPTKSAVEPMVKLFSAPKQLELFDGPHAPPMEVLVPAMNKFFDQTLGPVGR